MRLKGLMLLFVLCFLAVTCLGVVVPVYSQPEDAEEEEPIQARPNPMDTISEESAMIADDGEHGDGKIAIRTGDSSCEQGEKLPAASAAEQKSLATSSDWRLEEDLGVSSASPQSSQDSAEWDPGDMGNPTEWDPSEMGDPAEQDPMEQIGDLGY